MIEKRTILNLFYILNNFKLILYLTIFNLFILNLNHKPLGLRYTWAKNLPTRRKTKLLGTSLNIVQKKYLIVHHGYLKLCLKDIFPKKN